MENGGSHAFGGEDGWEQNLMWDIPSAPNNGRYCLAERFLGGHTLVAVGVGKRLMVMTKENFGVSSPNPNTSSPFARSENAAPWMPLWGNNFHRDPPEFRVWGYLHAPRALGVSTHHFGWVGLTQPSDMSYR